MVVPLQRLLLLHPVSAGAHPGEMKPSMEHMTNFVLTAVLFFFPPLKIALFLFFRLFTMPGLIGEFTSFHPKLKKSFAGLRLIGNIPCLLPSLT